MKLNGDFLEKKRNEKKLIKTKELSPNTVICNFKPQVKQQGANKLISTNKQQPSTKTKLCHLKSNEHSPF